jgi:hypothetical protein
VIISIDGNNRSFRQEVLRRCLLHCHNEHLNLIEQKTYDETLRLIQVPLPYWCISTRNRFEITISEFCVTAAFHCVRKSTIARLWRPKLLMAHAQPLPESAPAFCCVAQQQIGE